MQKINPSVAIHWHPVFNYPIGMAEVGVHGEAITESGRGIDDMKAAAELLIAKLGQPAIKQTGRHLNVQIVITSIRHVLLLH